MPVVIIQPEPDLVFGPGRQVNVVTTTVGPFLNPEWSIQWTPDDTHDGEVLSQSVPTSDPHVPTVIQSFRGGQMGFAVSSNRSGTTGHLKAALISGGAEVESLSISVKADFVEGVLQQILNQQTSGTVGFNATDRENLVTTTESVSLVRALSLPAVGQIAFGLADVIGSVPLQATRKAETFQISGVGFLDRPVGTGQVSAVGAKWTVVEAPDGAGLFSGVVTRWQQRILQLAVLRSDALAVNEITDVADFDTAGQDYIWGFPLPRRIDYWVTPGFVLDWTWIILVAGN